MLTFCVLHPEAFDKSHFDDRHYGKFAKMFLRSLDSNNILLLDGNDCLFDKFEENVRGLKLKDRQELEIRLEELRKMLQSKKGRRAIVRCSLERCKTELRQTVHRQCGILSSNARVDAVVCGAGANSELRTEVKNVPVIELPDFSDSKTEQQRREWMDQLPPNDLLAPGLFDDLIIRATCYSTWLRLYDKQIGKATNPSNFRRGIERILRLWIKNCHFVPSSVEIITTESERENENAADFVNQRRATGIRDKISVVKSRIIEPLQKQFSVPITLIVKQDPNNTFHARHLQSQNANLLFERGFDFLTDDGEFRRAFLKMDNGAQAHLQAYRTLPESEFNL
jgi:hypothetical protein